MRRSCLLLLPLSACIEQETPAPTADDLKIARRDVLSADPSPRFPAGAELEDKLVYLGMDADPPTATPGKPVKLTHYWKVKQPPGEGWKLFVHLGPQKGGYVNADHSPVRGRYPESFWKAGEIIRDQHTVSLPARWPAPQIEVYVGFYKGAQRLRVVKGEQDGQNRVLAAKIPVGASAVPEQKRPRYVARRVTVPIKIDGKLDDPAWQEAPFSDAFVDTMTGAKVEAQTQAKIVWDDTNLYVAFSTDDRDVASSFSRQDDKLWTQDAVELFIDADGDGKDYVELQASPAGVLFDSYLPGHRQNQNDWQSGAKAATQVSGTLNKRGDEDRGFTTELVVPLAAAKGRAEKPLDSPAPGRVWRINLFRMDLDQGKPQRASGWSPPLVGDFHALDRFGDLVFGDAAGSVPAATTVEVVAKPGLVPRLSRPAVPRPAVSSPPAK